MIIGCITRGKTRNEDYSWLGFDTESEANDKHWLDDASVRKRLEQVSLMEILSQDEPGIALSRESKGEFNVLLNSFATDFDSARGGKITASFVFFGLSEGVARGICIRALSGWDSLGEGLIPCIQRLDGSSELTLPSGKRWDFDHEKIHAYVQKIEPAPSLDESSCAVIKCKKLGREGCFDAGEDFPVFVKDVKEISFSHSPGLKFAIGNIKDAEKLKNAESPDLLIHSYYSKDEEISKKNSPERKPRPIATPTVSTQGPDGSIRMMPFVVGSLVVAGIVLWFVTRPGTDEAENKETPTSEIQDRDSD